MRRVLGSVLLGIALLLASGCQADALLEVQVDDDGGGVVYVAVALDRDAAARTVLYEASSGGSLPVDDLVAAGWTVNGPLEEPDGRVWVRARKAFSQLDQLGVVVEEVAGADGPFRDFAVQQTTRFGVRDWQFRGTVDLGDGLGAFSDSGVAALLGGEALGRPGAAFREELGQSLEDAVTMTVVVDLPGRFGEHNGVIGAPGQAAAPTPVTGTEEDADEQADAPATTMRVPSSGAAVVWKPSFTDAAPTMLSAASSDSRLAPRLWRWAGLASGAAALMVIAYRTVQLLVVGRRDRRLLAAPAGAVVPPDEDDPEVTVRVAADGDPAPGSTSRGALRTAPAHEPVGTRPVSAAPVGAAGLDSTTVATGPRRSGGEGVASNGPALIVLETAGALLGVKDMVGDALVPFVRERGCTLTAGEIAECYLARTIGTSEPEEFWAALGVEGNAMLLDDRFAATLEISEEVLGFLGQARNRGVDVVALADEAPEWTMVLRQQFGLDGLIGGWVHSADVGSRPPHPGFLDAALHIGGVPPARVLVVAGQLALLDLAARRGCRTVHYAPDAEATDERHPVLRSFARQTPVPGDDGR